VTAQIISFPGSNRSHWDSEDERAFEFLRREGRTSPDAASYVERQIISRNVPDTGETRLLRQAREAMRELQPRAPA